MARVKQLQINDVGEITGAIVQKSSSGECVKRHSSVIIPLLRMKDNANRSDAVPGPPVSDADEPSVQVVAAAPRRQCLRAAAAASKRRTRAMLRL